ncbi:helix-turn-helix transcriptional regulator [Plantibacter sp. Mn2098]|uniref:helix-turn-helix transcriptional regulator n=1 Tax=Plantibacter sp. Mn2098 TaxID=3395266 RepID=UPI003BDBE71C
MTDAPTADRFATGGPITELRSVRAAAPRLSARQTAIARAGELVEHHTSLLLVGQNGFGKSFAAKRIQGRLELQGRNAVVLGGGDADTTEILESWRSTPSGTVFIVDDGDRLDLASIPSVIEIARASTHAILITIEPLQADVDGTRSDDGTSRLLSIWRGGELTRVDLPVMNGTEAAELIDIASQGEMLDDMSRSTIIRLAHGSPRLVYELTKDALETGGSFYVPRSILSLGDSAMSPRLHDLTLPLLERTDDLGRYSLVMLAKLGPTPYARATRLLGEAPLHDLLRLGLARNDGTSLDRIVAEELHAWSALSDWRRSWRSRQFDVVQRKLITDLVKGFRLTPNENFIIGRFWMNESDEEVLEDVTAEVAAKVLLTAAHVANVAGLASDAHLLATRSSGFQRSLAAALQESRALAMLGDISGARAAIDLPEDVEAAADDHRERLSWEITLGRWERHGPVGRISALSIDSVDAPARSLTDHALLVDNWREGLSGSETAIAAFTAMLDDESAAQSTRLYAAASILAQASPFATAEEAQNTLERGYAVYRQISYHELRPLSHSTRDASAMFFLVAGLVRLEAGFPWAELEQDITVFSERAGTSSGQMSTIDQCVVGILRGAIAIVDGEMERAVADLSVVERLLDSTLPPEVHAFTSVTLALAYTNLGQFDEAGYRRNAFDREIIASSEVLVMFTNMLDFAMLTHLQGAAAGATFLAGIATDERRSASARIYAAHLSRLAGCKATIAGGWIRDIRFTDLTPLPHALVSLLYAEANQDAALAEQAAKGLEVVGATHRASRAYALAEQLHLAQGRPSQAQRAGLHAARLADTGRPSSFRRLPASERMTVAPMPSRAEAPIRPVVDLDDLTKRELEIAQLVAEGLSNQEIANRLFLSVRTVESHVLQARTKLGAPRRRDLGRLVAGSPFTR